MVFILAWKREFKPRLFIKCQYLVSPIRYIYAMPSKSQALLLTIFRCRGPSFARMEFQNIRTEIFVPHRRYPTKLQSSLSLPRIWVLSLSVDSRQLCICEFELLDNTQASEQRDFVRCGRCPGTAQRVVDQSPQTEYGLSEIVFCLGLNTASS